MEGPWLLAAALEMLADGVEDNVAAARLESLARGSRQALRGAYARALALAGELPRDRSASRAVELFQRAMRRQWDGSPSRLNGGAPAGRGQSAGHS